MDDPEVDQYLHGFEVQSKTVWKDQNPDNCELHLKEFQTLVL